MTAPVPFSFHEFDLDGARAAIAQNYFPTTLDLCSAAAPYEFGFAGHMHGPLTVGDAWYTSGMNIGIEEVGSLYINIATGGTLLARQRGQVVAVDLSQGVAFQATGEVSMTTSDDYSCLAVKIAPGALEGELEAILGRPITRPLAVSPKIDLRTRAGAGWARLVRLLVSEAGPGGMASTEIVAAPLREAVLHGLLRAVDHPYRDVLDAPAPSFAPAALRRIVDAVEADPTRDLTLADMARTAAVSVRTLQELYRRHLDTTPTEHLRRTRLARAHEQLRASDPTETTVSAVARRWGFVHIGRFARTYRARYGEPPSATLRHPPPHGLSGHAPGRNTARPQPSTLMPLNPDLDRDILGLFEKGDLARFDEFTVEWLGERGGSSVIACPPGCGPRESTCSCSPSSARRSRPRAGGRVDHRASTPPRRSPLDPHAIDARTSRATMSQKTIRA